MSLFKKVAYTVCSGIEDPNCENFVQKKQLPAFKKHCVCSSKTKEVVGPNPVGYALVAGAIVVMSGVAYWQITSTAENFLGSLVGDLFSSVTSSSSTSVEKGPVPVEAKSVVEKASIPTEPTPSDSPILIKIGELVGKGDYREVVEVCKTALKATPNDAALLTNLGSALLKLKQFGEAKEYLERAVTLKPNDPYFRYNLGAAEALLGHKDAALSALKEACRLGLAPATFRQDSDFSSLSGNKAFENMIATKSCQ